MEFASMDEWVNEEIREELSLGSSVEPDFWRCYYYYFPRTSQSWLGNLEPG